VEVHAVQYRLYCITVYAALLTLDCTALHKFWSYSFESTELHTLFQSLPAGAGFPSRSILGARPASNKPPPKQKQRRIKGPSLALQRPRGSGKLGAKMSGGLLKQPEVLARQLYTPGDAGRTCIERITQSRIQNVLYSGVPWVLGRLRCTSGAPRCCRTAALQQFLERRAQLRGGVGQHLSGDPWVRAGENLKGRGTVGEADQTEMRNTASGWIEKQCF